MPRPDTTGGFEVVARYEAESDATEAAASLVERGTGAIVERQDHEAPFALLVVDGGAERAREALQLPTADDPDAPPERLARPNIFWIVLIFLAAMIILPLVGFYASFKLSGG